MPLIDPESSTEIRYTLTKKKGVRDASRGHALSELGSECSSACVKDNDAHAGQAVTFFHAETVVRTAAGQGRRVVMIGLGHAEVEGEVTEENIVLVIEVNSLDILAPGTLRSCKLWLAFNSQDKMNQEVSWSWFWSGFEYPKRRVDNPTSGKPTEICVFKLQVQRRSGLDSPGLRFSSHPRWPCRRQ